MPMIDRTGAEVLIPQENTREIIQMVPESSVMMRLMRRLPDMGSNTRMIPVLSALPMSYFVDAIRTVFVRGGGLSSIWHQVLALLAIGSLMGTWAVLSYKKNS